jgi:hypothetical protein
MGAKKMVSFFPAGFIESLMSASRARTLPHRKAKPSEPTEPTTPRKMYGNSKWHRRATAAGLKGQC